MTDRFYSINQEELVDLRLYQTGFQECEPNHFFGPVARHHYLFHFIHEGKGRLEIVTPQGFRTYYLQKHQGFLCSPGQRSSYFADANNPWTYSWIELDGIQANRLFANAGLSETEPIYRAKNLVAAESIIKELDFITTNKQASNINLLAHSILFLDLLQQGSTYKPINIINFRKEDYIRSALLFIEKNYYYPISAQDISNYCMLNKNYLSRLFKDATNKTLIEFLIEFRLHKAQDLLRSTDKPIGEISSNVGYSNPLHFSRSFSQLFGESPRSWRKTHQVQRKTEINLPE